MTLAGAARVVSLPTADFRVPLHLITAFTRTWHVVLDPGLLGHILHLHLDVQELVLPTAGGAEVRVSLHADEGDAFSVVTISVPLNNLDVFGLR